MRRWLCVLQIGVLASVLWPGVVSASLANAFAPPSIDLSAQLFARLFGESSDRDATFNAVTGDALAETPLRDLALRVDDTAPTTVTAPAIVAELPSPSLTLSDPSFAPPSQSPARLSSIADLSSQLHVPAVEYYEGAAPNPTDAPATQRFDLSHLQVAPLPPAAFAPASLDASAPNGAQGASVRMPLHLGKLRFSPHAEAAQTQNLQPNFTNAALGAGATLDVRAGSRNLGVDLSSQLEHATLSAPQFSTTGAPAVGLANDNLPVFVPAYADVSAHTLSTGVTVPVTRSLTANLQFDTQHLLGTYGQPGISNIDANNTIYGAQLTYNIPRWSSAISFSASQYHFQDNLVPSNALTQTNANVNFTIKF
jgi:hypothetical protein